MPVRMISLKALSVLYVTELDSGVSIMSQGHSANPWPGQDSKPGAPGLGIQDSFHRVTSLEHEELGIDFIPLNEDISISPLEIKSFPCEVNVTAAVEPFT